MTDMSVWMGLLGAEVLLILFALLLVSWIRQNAAARRDRKAIATLIEAAKENRAQREQQIVGYLKKTFGMDDAAAEAAKLPLVREEFKLLQRFGLIYRNRDAAAASKFSMFVEAALEPYHDMSGGTVAEAVAPEAAEGEVDTSELEHLRNENKRLSEELSVTMDTMSRMLSEYSTMFADTGGAAPQAATEDPDSSVEPDGEALSQAEPEAADGDEDLPLREAQLEPEALDIGAEAEPGETGANEPMELLDDDEDGMDPETLLFDSAGSSEPEPEPESESESESQPEPENEVLEIDEQVELEATSVDRPDDEQPIDSDSAALQADDVDKLFESVVEEQQKQDADQDVALPTSDDEAPIDPDGLALIADDLDDLFDGVDEEKKARKDQDDDTVII